jgi:hypothetical protein
MLTKLLSSVYYIYKKITTPNDYQIISEEIEYTVNYDMKYQTEDIFWKEESKDWDGILENFYVNATGRDFRNTLVPQNVGHIILRINYYFNGRVYTVISNDLNFKLGESEKASMIFKIPLSSVWIVDHDDKPRQNITEKVKRYSGPTLDFHKQKVTLEDFLYYDSQHLHDKFPKIILANGIGMKKTISTTSGFTTDLRIP